jgi:tRNA(Ile)-lysidine synthase
VEQRGQTPAEALQAALSGLEPGARLGVAVSGGSDSTAALVLAAEALGLARLEAATVDHRLRSEAAAEADGVAALCARLGIAHAVLRADPSAWRGNRMDAARRARLALLSDWARGRGLCAVILAHTQDDQAETLLMRLARGSGVDGLAAMAPARPSHGTLWLRPFLGTPRAMLRQVLVARGIGWIEDPTNADPRHLRTRARVALAALAPLGIGAAGLAATAARLAQARAALEAAEAEALARLGHEDRGTVLLDLAAFDLPQDLRDRLLAGLIGRLSGAPYRPRLASLHRALAAVAQGRGATLGGVVLLPEAGGLRLAREAQAVADLDAPVPGPWDGRWHAGWTGAGPAPGGARIAALGQTGLAALGRQAAAGLHPHWRQTGLAPRVLAGMPAIWRGAALVAAPLALWPQGWVLEARPLVARGPAESD